MAKTSLSRLVGELKPYRAYLLGGLALLLVAGPASLIPTLMWMFVVDIVLLDERMDLLIPFLGLAVGAYAISAFCGAWRDRLLEHAGQRFIRDLRGRLFARILRQNPGYLQQQRTGDLQARVISDVDAVQSSLISGFSSLIQESYSFLLVLGAIVWINPLIGGTVFVPLLICFFIIRHFNARMKRYYREARTALGEVGNQLQEVLGGFPVVKAFHRGKTEQEAFQAVTETHYEKTMRAVYLRTRLFPIIFSIAFSTNVIMLGLGAWLVYLGHFTLGGLVALRGFWWQLNSPVRTLAQVNDMVQRALAASGRIYQILDAPLVLDDAPGAKPLLAGRHSITFERVSFAYEGSGLPVLKGLNLTVAPGEIIALSGSSGAGKSTFLNLLARFYDPTEGQILIGGQPLAEITQESWRSRLGFVFQETFLFNTSVLENIRYGRPTATEEEVREAARLANADSFIAGLPQGYGTITGERGIKLSGGQRQRIGVARAFLANPDILLMDEPTSSVEPESERIIQESLLALMSNRTVFLSSHRPSLLQRADRVLHLEEGRLIESGSHERLMEADQAYAAMIRLWNPSLAG